MAAVPTAAKPPAARDAHSERGRAEAEPRPLGQESEGDARAGPGSEERGERERGRPQPVPNAAAPLAQEGQPRLEPMKSTNCTAMPPKACA